MDYILEGKIKKIMPRQDFPSGFYKQQFVVTTNDKYPQDIALECLKEDCDLLKDRQVGDAVKVHFNLRGREWNDKFYNDISAWKIEGEVSGGQSTPEPQKPAYEAPTGDDNDIPF